MALGRDDASLAGELFAKESKQQTHANVRERWIVTRTFVAEECVGGIEFVPFKLCLRFIEPLCDLEAPLEGNVGILPAPNEKNWRPRSSESLQCVVVLARTKRARMNIRRIKGDYGADIRMKARPNRKMPAKADTVTSNPARAPFVSAKEFHDSLGVFVVRRQFLGIFQLVPSVGPRLVVSQDGSRRLKLMIDLRHRNKVTVTTQRGSHSADRPGDLEYFRVEDHAGMAFFSLRDEQMDPHRAP